FDSLILWTLLIKSTLSISIESTSFKFNKQRPERSVIFILSRKRGESYGYPLQRFERDTGNFHFRGGSHRPCSLAQDQLGFNLNSGKETVVFLSKIRKICKIVTTDVKGTMLLTRSLHNQRFEKVMLESVSKQATCSLTLSDLERFLNGVRLYIKGYTFVVRLSKNAI
ncbi:IS66 family insertion sequence element accessory protein TnpB, partial [Parasutterella excrementihominis]